MGRSFERQACPICIKAVFHWMIFLRSVIAWVFGSLATSLICFIIFIVSLVDRGSARINRLIVLWARILLALTGVRVTVTGGENVPRQGPVLFVANHRGAFDIPALQHAIPREFKWVAKKSLFSIPALGWSMTLAGFIPIDRQNAQAAYSSMEAAVERIKNGACVLIFPEGTRNSTDEPLLPFKRGSFLLAVKSGVPVVPVAIDGTRDILRKGGFMINPAPVRVRIGMPIDSAGANEKMLREKARAAIEGLFAMEIKR